MKIFKRIIILTICLLSGFCLGFACNQQNDNINNISNTFINYNIPQTYTLYEKYSTKDAEFIFIWTRLNFNYKVIDEEISEIINNNIHESIIYVLSLYDYEDVINNRSMIEALVYEQIFNNCQSIENFQITSLELEYE